MHSLCALTALPYPPGLPAIQVQLQILTAIVKLFLQKPQGTQELVQRALSLATQDSDNPDLRDRGYIYWRLLSTDPAAAKVCALAGIFFFNRGTLFPLPCSCISCPCDLVYHIFFQCCWGWACSLPIHAGTHEFSREDVVFSSTVTTSALLFTHV